MELVAYLIEKNIPIKIINTFRTEEEQKMCLANGTSWVERSKHQDGLAIDICPWAIFELHGHNKLAWDADDPIWDFIGPIGESLELTWGGRWRVKDLGHFEQRSEE